MCVCVCVYMYLYVCASARISDTFHYLYHMFESILIIIPSL